MHIVPDKHTHTHTLHTRLTCYIFMHSDCDVPNNFPNAQKPYCYGCCLTIRLVEVVGTGCVAGHLRKLVVRVLYTNGALSNMLEHGSAYVHELICGTVINGNDNGNADQPSFVERTQLRHTQARQACAKAEYNRWVGVRDYCRFQSGIAMAKYPAGTRPISVRVIMTEPSKHILRYAPNERNSCCMLWRHKKKPTQIRYTKWPRHKC